MLHGTVERRWPGLFVQPRGGRWNFFPDAAGARLTPCSVCRGCSGNGVAQRGGEQREEAGRAAPRPPGAWRGQELVFAPGSPGSRQPQPLPAGRNNGVRCKEFPKSYSEFHPQLGGRMVVVMEEVPLRVAPVSAPSSTATLTQHRPCRAAGPDPAPTPAAHSCCPQRPSVRPAGEPVQAPRASVGAKEVPVGDGRRRGPCASPCTQGCWPPPRAPGDTVGSAEPPTPHLGAAAWRCPKAPAECPGLSGSASAPTLSQKS